MAKQVKQRSLDSFFQLKRSGDSNAIVLDDESDTAHSEDTVTKKKKSKFQPSWKTDYKWPYQTLLCRFEGLPVEKQYKLSNLVSLSAGLGQRRSINKQNGGLCYLVFGCPLTSFVLRKLGLFEFIFLNN